VVCGRRGLNSALGIGTALAAHVLATAVELNEKAACRAIVGTALTHRVLAGETRVPLEGDRSGR